MKKKRISVVSYNNSIPFKYGLTHSDINTNIELSFDTPAECSDKLISNKVDIGLVPIISLPKIKDANIISEYCIGASREVKTVTLYSEVPLKDIKTIYLDYQSRTSVQLVKLLAKKFWRLPFNFKETNAGFETTSIRKDNAAIIIGDRNFRYEKVFQYKIDLAQEWIKYTGLPMVFACWVANKNIEKEFITEFNNALSFGINNIQDAIEDQNDFYGSNKDEVKNYLMNNIDYILDNKKIESLNYFLKICYPHENLYFTQLTHDYEITKK